MTDNPTIAVLGAGSWGTALAIQLARNNQRVNLWGHRTEHIEALISARENTAYLPDIKLSENINPDASLDSCLNKAEVVLIAIPSKAFRGLLQSLKTRIDPGADVFWACKGIEIETGKLLHQVVCEELPGHHYGVVSGPTFAGEVAQGFPTAITCAGDEQHSTTRFANLLHGNRFRCYTSDDVIGVELGGAIKNILAIAVGVADGLGFGANTHAALMTRGLTEVMELGQKLGARQETLMGLAGLGDLILTCTDDQSRNRRFGLAIGRGKSVQQAESDIGQTVEGLRVTSAVHNLALDLKLDLPIMQQVYQVLYEGKEPLDAVKDLESRPQRAERG